EVGAPLAGAEGQGGQAVLEYLLEAEEFQHAEVEIAVKPEAPLVGPDGVAELNAKAAVDADIAAVVLPGNPERQGAVRLGDALEDLGIDVVGLVLHVGDDDPGDLAHRLVKLRFAGIAAGEALHEGVETELFSAGHGGAPEFGSSLVTGR